MRLNLAYALNYRRDFSLRLGMAVGALIISSVVIISLGLAFTMREFWRDERGQDFSELAYHMADKLDRGMFERYREIIQLSQRNTLRRGIDNPDELRPYLESIQTTYPYYAWIGYTNTDGVVIAATNGLLEGESVSERAWFVQGQIDVYIGDVHDAVLLSPYLSTGGGAPVRLIDLSTPIYDTEGNVIAVLGAHLSWDWAKDMRASILEPLRDHALIDMTVIGKSGTVLLSRYPDALGVLWTLAEIPPERDSGYVFGSSGGMPYLVGYARTSGYSSYPGLGWTVVVSQPVEIAFEAVNELGLRVFVVFVSFAVAIAFMAYLIARILLRPVIMLAAAADRIRPDDPEANLPIIDGTDEIASLSRSLHTMFKAQKAYQTEITRYSAELEERVSERTLELRQRNAEVELLLSTTRDALERERTLNAFKARFTSLINHEFRTPLAGILSSASILQSYEDRMTPEKKQEHLQRIETNVKDLDGLLDEVLTLSRTETIPSQMPRDPTDIRELVQDVIYEFQTVSEQHTITLSVVGEPRLIPTYAKLLKQAVSNLISNAIKYSPNSSAIQVRVRFDDALEIAVEDRGIGMTPDDITRLYEPFFRGQNVGTIKGTGLGLVVVKQAMDAHGGTITIKSQISVGSTFTLVIPDA